MEENNKRIAKNVVYLYIRQIVIMVLSFLTTRIVLEKLGASDYGVNNVVGGFVSMFTVLNGILHAGTRRFLSLNLGKNNPQLLKDTFSTSFVIHLVTGLAVVLLLETFGIWFLNTHLNIDACRMTAANWVFQFSVISVFLGVTQTPFVAAVTSHEHLNIYAYMSIYDTVAKLLVLFVLVYLPGDKLIIYAALQMIVNVVSMTIDRIYCVRKFTECKFSLHVNCHLLRDMTSFSGWSVIGNLFVVGNTQGVSILLNVFFNTVVNASRGLATTVTYTISQFVNGFIIAGEPQLVKFYGSGDKANYIRLVYNLTQYTLFLLSFFAVPVFMEVDYVLELWLGEVPPYTSEFIKITILSSLVMNSYVMIDKAIVAAGYIKQIALIANTIPIIQLPLTYIVLKLGCSPTSAYWITIVPQLIGMFVDLWIIKKYVGFPSVNFFFTIIVKNSVLLATACVVPYIIQGLMNPGLVRFLVVCAISVISTVTIMWTFALNRTIKNMIKSKLFKR